MRFALWPEASAEEHAAELRNVLAGVGTGSLPIVELVAASEDGALVGFAEVGLRSHADGCDPARPAGYLEGWFVAEPYRLQGIGARLVAAAMEWTRSQGCVEFASDVLLENELSQKAHRALGFEEVSRLVVYRKPLRA